MNNPPFVKPGPKPAYANRFGTKKSSAASKHVPPGASAASRLDGAIAALNGYIGAEPDAADKATAQGIIAQIRALQAKDKRDLGGSAKSMALGRV